MGQRRLPPALHDRIGSWQQRAMRGHITDSRVHRRWVDALYVEAMVLADEARAYFDEQGRAEREALEPLARVTFSCESLKVTTRLMHVIAWLLTQRAVLAGEMRREQALDEARRLGEAPVSEAAVTAALPDRAQLLIDASIDLHRRASRLDRAQVSALTTSPVKALHDRLALAF